MAAGTPTFRSVQEYVAAAPDGVRPALERVRELAREVIPGSTEGIRYSMPAILMHGRAVAFFAARKNHLAFYGVHPAADSVVEARIAPLRATGATVRVPLDGPLDDQLVMDVLRVSAAR